MKSLITLLFLAVSTVAVSQTQVSIYDQDKETVLRYFKTETIGGRLDFEAKMKEDKAPFYLIENTMYNRKDYSILLWAQAIKRTNKLKKNEAIKLWEEIKQRRLTKAEKRAFLKGFSMDI